MLLLFAALFFVAVKSDGHCVDTCVYPFVYHNFTNCEQLEEAPVPRRGDEDGICDVKCPNEGTWTCSHYSGFSTCEPDDQGQVGRREFGLGEERGFVSTGDVYFNLPDCCIMKNVHTVETVLKIRSFECIRIISDRREDDPEDPKPDSAWEFEIHNIQVRGGSPEPGICTIRDKKPVDPLTQKLTKEVLIEDCYEPDVCYGNLMHMTVVLDYCAEPTVPEPEEVEVRRQEYEPLSCEMALKFYIEGVLVATTTDFVMDKWYALTMPVDPEPSAPRRCVGDECSTDPDFVIGWFREMFEFNAALGISGECIDEIHFLRMWDVVLPDEVIANNAMNWATQTPEDAYCPEPCYTPNMMKEQFMDSIRGLDLQIWHLITIFFVILLFMCFCWIACGCLCTLATHAIRKAE